MDQLPENIPLPPTDDCELELPPIPTQVPPPPEEVPLPEDPPQPTSSDSRTESRSKNKRKQPDDEAPGFLKEEESAMAKMLGFSSFNSTKGKHVPGNKVGAVHVVKKRRYRQYMNRKGGFNRPLDKVA